MSDIFSQPFCPRLPTVKVLVFLGHFWLRLPTVKVLFFVGHFWPRLATVNFFAFLTFLAKVSKGESFCSSWPFLTKVTNGESFVFFGQFWLRLPTVNVLFFVGHFWRRLPKVKVLTILAMVTFIGHLVYEYQWWKLCLWFGIAFEQPLASGSAKREFTFAGGNLWHPAVQAGVRAPGGNCWHGIESTSISYTPRQAFARKYDYICTTVEKTLRPFFEGHPRNRLHKKILAQKVTQIFSGKFGEIQVEIPSHPQKVSCSYNYDQLNCCR